MNTLELKAAVSALETALEQVRQLTAADPEPKPELERRASAWKELCEEYGL